MAPVLRARGLYTLRTTPASTLVGPRGRHARTTAAVHVRCDGRRLARCAGVAAGASRMASNDTTTRHAATIACGAASDCPVSRDAGTPCACDGVSS